MKKVLAILGGVIGTVLGVVVAGFIWKIIPTIFFMPVFLIVPIAVLVLLNSVSRNRNLPMVLKTFGVVIIFSCIVIFLVRPLQYNVLWGRNLPLLGGCLGFAICFLFFFIWKLKGFWYSTGISVLIGICFGIFLPAFVNNLNAIYDSSNPRTETVRIAEVEHVFGDKVALVRMNRADFEMYKISVKVQGDVANLKAGDSVEVSYHDGFLGISWCNAHTVEQ